MGTEGVSGPRRAFYAPRGSRFADLIALLHPPYTAWHLSYVVIGAALATSLDPVRLAGSLAAFGLGTGLLAHSLDEWHGRPLRTGFGDSTLLGFAALAGVGVLAVTVVGAVVVSPWVVAWAVGGAAAAIGYAIERPAWLHGTWGFALAWGAFPVLAGYWAQAENLSVEGHVRGSARLHHRTRTLARAAPLAGVASVVAWGAFFDRAPTQDAPRVGGRLASPGSRSRPSGSSAIPYTRAGFGPSTR